VEGIGARASTRAPARRFEQPMPTSISRRRFVPAAFATTLLLATPADAGTRRSCDYVVRVKSAGARIPSMDVTGGRIRFEGEEWVSGNEKRNARWAASQGAQQCLERALEETAPDCSEWVLGAQGKFRSRHYELRALRRTALDQLCEAHARAGGRGPIPDYEIFVQVLGSTSTVRNECAKHLGGRIYTVIDRGRNVRCEGSSLAPQPESRWSGYYLESATDVRRRIDDHCYKRLSEGRVEEFGVDPTNGKLRARFTCF